MVNSISTGEQYAYISTKLIIFWKNVLGMGEDKKWSKEHQQCTQIILKQNQSNL